MDESAEQTALREALDELSHKPPRINSAVYYLSEESQNPKAHRLAAKLQELCFQESFRLFQEADLSGETVTSDTHATLGHYPEHVVSQYVYGGDNIRNKMSSEMNELATKMVQIEAVHNEVFRSARMAIGVYRFLGDKDKIAEMQNRINLDKERKYGEEPIRTDQSYYLETVRQFVEDTKDFPLMSKDEISQQVSEIRDEVKQMLDELRESED